MTVRVDGATNEQMTPSATSGDGAPSFDELVANPVRFRLWYDGALPRVYRYLLARCGDPSLTEETTQEAFVEAIRSRRRFEGRSDPVTWICTIGRRRLADHVRRDHRDSIRHLRLVGAQSDRETSAWGQSDVREDVERALGALSSEQRLALMLRYLDAMRVREIAGLLRQSEKATESLLSRAREGFRRAYEGTDR
jgi:RNA polymerase sigma-70 factor, ECF subfamily